MERFNRRKEKDVEDKEQIQVITSKKFPTLENLEHNTEETLETIITNFRRRKFRQLRVKAA
jgi:hypothetical protein